MNECSEAQVDVGLPDLKTNSAVSTSNKGGRSWQTIVKQIWVAVSKVEVKRLRALKVVSAKVVVAKVSKAVNRPTVNLTS